MLSFPLILWEKGHHIWKEEIIQWKSPTGGNCEFEGRHEKLLTERFEWHLCCCFGSYHHQLSALHWGVFYLTFILHKWIPEQMLLPNLFFYSFFLFEKLFCVSHEFHNSPCAKNGTNKIFDHAFLHRFSPFCFHFSLSLLLMLLMLTPKHQIDAFRHKGEGKVCHLFWV